MAVGFAVSTLVGTRDDSRANGCARDAADREAYSASREGRVMPLPDDKTTRFIRVVAIDPGVTTGFALGVIDTVEGEMLVSSGQGKWSVNDLYEFLDKHDPHAVVLERFDYRNKSRSGLVLFSKELIGVMELWCQRQKEEKHIHRQMPGDAKAYFTNNELRSNGVYKQDSEYPHANDAMRHLLRWFVFGPGFRYNKKGYKHA